jgi:hypothetical protein
MTELKKSNVVSYIAFLRLNYGEKAYNYNESDLNKYVNYWYSQLKDYPKEVVDKAIQGCINTCEFAPTIAHILKFIRSMNESLAQDEIALWGELESVLYEVYDNSTKYKYASGEKYIEANRRIFDNLPNEIKAYVKNCRQLVALANADEKTLSIEKGRFINALPKIREREQMQALLPQEYKELINQVGNKFLLQNKINNT